MSGTEPDPAAAHMPPDGPPLSVPPAPPAYVRTHVTWRSTAITVVELRGDIDLLAVPEVMWHLDEATAPPRARVVVDIRPTDFFGCTGLSLLCRARRRAVERDGRLALVCVHPQHLRILEIAQLNDVFRSATTLADACVRVERDAHL